MLHRYIEYDCEQQDFLYIVSSLVMREPITEEEMREDKERKYYLLGATKNERKTAGRIYSGSGGRTLPVQKAKKLCSHYKPDKLVAMLKALEPYDKREFVQTLNAKGVRCNQDNFALIVPDLIKRECDRLSEGKRVKKTTLSDEATAAKEKYGAYLKAEEHEICPFPRCTHRLYQKTGNKREDLFDVVIIDLSQDHGSVENMLAACPFCAAKYNMSREESLTNQLIDMKLRLQGEFEAQDVLSRDEVIDGLQKIIDMIPNIPSEKLGDLNFEPHRIHEKMDGTDKMLERRIIADAKDYFNVLDDMFKSADEVKPFDYDRFGNTIKYKYKDITETGTLTQEQVFKMLTEWIMEYTNGNRIPCEVLVSYYVQRCEVFYAISE